ncbi:MAG TPA: (2Fe-2S)-binding protein [Symbiobacteriaceae bacterium]|nr:(2Fe-2S)-binding protein [Symbiobacteriaceae bacterium]
MSIIRRGAVIRDQHVIRVKVNGIVYEEAVESRKLLSDFIRENLGLKGTHVGCEHGVCGSCTVQMNGRTVRSCLTFAVEANGAEILTVEGLSDGEQLHPLQEAFNEHHGLQCGFCTPGMLMSAKELLERNFNPTEQEVRLGLSGNICRCTGYTGIVDAVHAAAQKLKEKREGGCCMQ